MASASSSDSERDNEERIDIEDALSPETLAALQSHRAAAAATARAADAVAAGGSLVSENFGLSQFWYDDNTQRTLATELLAEARGGKIAILSAPSLMHGIELLGEAERGCVHIFEYDRRFGNAYPAAFVFYDCNAPADVPPALHGACDVVLADPPYLSPETVENFFVSIDTLAKRPLAKQSSLGTPPSSETEERKEASMESKGATAGAEAATEAESGSGVPTPALFITSPRNTELLATRGFRPLAFQLCFASKFATPMALFANYESERLPAAAPELLDGTAEIEAAGGPSAAAAAAVGAETTATDPAAAT
ncbi:unnamed protein product [Phaeothamnion confervicola]